MSWWSCRLGLESASLQKGKTPLTSVLVALSAGSVECTDSFSLKGHDSPNECQRYDSKQSDGEAPVMLEVWGIQSTPLLPSFSGLLRLGVVASDRAPFMGQIGLNCTYVKLDFWKLNCFYV